ncbi:F-box/WD repeat protein Pop1 [Schizosaccharomyces japonicus yFS275]|uniref:F-box/WD repeat protein Pop1 n=1 Tax=Schizosaccharomyces japonicus (strain yFS275 / FY16936) TaxID=402676 RepID=B6K0T6_SCHJY|nr:F-box/WD repeat protein Pop1 [Schizosaccharomyces japonicus yFS275]EEB07557.2 F-box/WD repeat protein Pop1 [Schizosaccharomyces japonicus yFS275]
MPLLPSVSKSNNLSQTFLAFMERDKQDTLSKATLDPCEGSDSPIIEKRERSSNSESGSLSARVFVPKEFSSFHFSSPSGNDLHFTNNEMTPAVQNLELLQVVLNAFFARQQSGPDLLASPPSQQLKRALFGGDRRELRKRRMITSTYTCRGPSCASPTSQTDAIVNCNEGSPHTDKPRSASRSDLQFNSQTSASDNHSSELFAPIPLVSQTSTSLRGSLSQRAAFPSSSPSSPSSTSSATSAVHTPTNAPVIHSSPSQMEAVMKMQSLLTSFSSFPKPVQSYLIFHFLQNSHKHTIQEISSLLNPLFQRDFLALLPQEICRLIINYLDASSLCMAAQVSRRWNTLLNCSREPWENLFRADAFHWERKDEELRQKWLQQSVSPCTIMKRIYLRHHRLRHKWLDKNTKPSVLSFPIQANNVITALQFDFEKVVVTSDDYVIHIYSTKTGKLLQRLEGHEDEVWAFQYVGNTLVSGSSDKTVRVWNMETGECKQVFYGHTSVIRCLRIVTNDDLHPTLNDENTPVITNSLPLNSYIVTGSRDSTIRVWKLPDLTDPTIPAQQETTAANTEEAAASAAVDRDNSNPYYIRTLRGHALTVRDIACAGDIVVSGSYDGTVRVWQASTGECLHVLRGHVDRVYSVIIDETRQRCISAGVDACIRIWSLITGECLHVLSGHTSLVCQVSLTQDILVSGSTDATLRVWDAETGKCKHVLKGHLRHVTCFQHDESKVISSSDGTLKLWDVRTGTFVRDLLSDLQLIFQVKFVEYKCVAAILRNNRMYLDILDFSDNATSPRITSDVTA